MWKLFTILVVSCFLGLPVIGFSQQLSASISGRVSSADGLPLSFASISLIKYGRLTMADANGHFKIARLPSLQDTLIISYINEVVFKKKILLSQGDSLDLGSITIKKEIKSLQNVEIIGRPAGSYKSNYSFFAAKTELETIDIPQSVSTVTGELIHDKMEFTLKDAVTDVSGVNQYSGYDEYTIRGFRAENPRCINGLRGYNTSFASSMLVNIDRIEVIKGPVAALYGNCDPGGTINLVTKKPLNHTVGQLDIFGGSWNHFRIEGDITGAINSDKSLLYRLNAGFDQKNSFRDQQFGKSYQIAPSISYIPSEKIRINLDFSLTHIKGVLDRGQPGFDNDPDLRATPVNLSISQPGNHLNEIDLATVLSFSYKINNRLSFNVGYLNYLTSQQVGEHGFNGYITPDSINLYYSAWDYHTVTNTLTSYFTYLIKTGNFSHKLLLGYDFVKSQVTLSQQYFELPDQFGIGSGIVGTFSLRNPLYDQVPVSTYQLSDFNGKNSVVDANVYHTQGVYLQDEVGFGRFKMLAGIREEFYKGDGEDAAESLNQHVFLPRLGIVYSLNKDLNVYGTYNKGFDPFEVASEAQVFDAPFKPVISELFELGIKGNFFQNKLGATLAFYNLIVNNVAVNANDPSNPNLFIQQGQNRSRGFEMEANGNINPNLSIMISYAFDLATVTSAKVLSEVGSAVANAPKNAGSTWIKYDFGKEVEKGPGISIGYSFASERNTLDPSTVLPGYFVLNGSFHYGFKHISAAILVNNILDKTYWIGAYNNVNKWPGAPRNIMVNLTYRF
jgi:iron complex outermembrane receptor protein